MRPRRDRFIVGLDCVLIDASFGYQTSGLIAFSGVPDLSVFWVSGDSQTNMLWHWTEHDGCVPTC